MYAHTLIHADGTPATVTSIVPWFVMREDVKSLSDSQIAASFRLLSQELQGRKMRSERAAA